VVRVPARVAAAAAGVAVAAGALAGAVFGSTVAPVTAVVVAAVVAEVTLHRVRRGVLASPVAVEGQAEPVDARGDGAPGAGVGDQAEVPADVPAAVAGTVLAGQWPRILAARAARKALAVLVAGAALAYPITMLQLAGQVYLPPGSDYGDVVAGVLSATVLAGMANYVRTALGTVGPSVLVLAAERVSTPRLLARLSAGIGLATVGLGSVFTVALLGFGQIFTASPADTVALGAIGLAGNAVAAWLYRPQRNPTGQALTRHAVGGALVGAGTVAVGAATLAGAPVAGLVAGAVLGVLTIAVGLSTVAEVRLDRHDLRGSTGRFAAALPGLPVLLARRLLDVPAAMREVLVLTKAYSRFARTRDVRLPLTDAQRADPGFATAVAASGRYVVRGGDVVDTFRVWADWNRLRGMDTLPEDLTDSRRRSAVAAVHAGLSRSEAARLIGVTRRTLNRWLADTSTTGGGGRGGPLAVGDLPARVVRKVLRVLPRLAGRIRPVSWRDAPSLPRGPPGTPPILIWDADAATVAALHRAGVPDPSRTLVAFGWVHPQHAPGGAIVIFRHVLHEVNRLVESGRLDPEWFTDLIAYETRFRIQEQTRSEDGRSREAVAADLLERLDRARGATPPTVHQLLRSTRSGWLRGALLR
jgi:hypothetical protein